jgi:PAS domain S-box-containing protein
MSSEFIKEFWKGHKEKKSTAYTEMVSPLGNRYFFVATSPFVNNKFVTSFFDITERKQAEEALRTSEEKFRSLLDSQEGNIMVLDFDGVHHYVNQAGIVSLTDSGAPQDIIGKRLHDLYPAHIADWQLEQIRRVITTGQGMYGDFQSIVDDQTSWWHLNLQPIRNASGQVVQVMVNSHDITKRKQADEALRASEENYRFLANNVPDIIYSLNGEGNIVTVNSPAFERYGYTEQDAKGKPFLDFIHPEDREIVIGSFLKALEEQRKFTHGLQFRIVAGNGVSYWFELNSQAHFDNQGGYAGEEGVLRDITARKQVEDALRESEDKLKTIIETSPDGIGISTLDGTVQFVTAKLVSALGYASAVELIGRNTMEFVDPSYQEKIRHLVNELLNGHLTGPAECLMVRKDGSHFYCEVNANILRDVEKNPIGILFVERDITARKQAEEENKKIARHYQVLIEKAPVGIILLNAEGNFKFASPSAKKIFGYQIADEVTGSPAEHTHPEDLPLVLSELSRMLVDRSYVPTLQYRYADKNGNWIWVESTFSNLLADPGVESIVINFRDITERKQAEQEIQQLNTELEQRVEERTQELREVQEKLVSQEKLAVLGQMASSVGHELRNPLSVIASAVYYLKLVQPNVDEKIKEYLGIIDQEVRTSEKIITDLLDFARVKSVDREAVPVSELIRQTLERFPVPASVNVSLEIPTDLPQAYVDVHQITQVLGNLTVNACQAMISGDVENGRQLSLYSRLQNDMIIITVKDSGAGIAPENIKKIFEPLFTTKAKGIGLGLAVSRKLVEANSGRIEVESEAGKGSSFHVFLPIYKKSK